MVGIGIIKKRHAVVEKIFVPKDLVMSIQAIKSRVLVHMIKSVIQLCNYNPLPCKSRIMHGISIDLVNLGIGLSIII